MENLNSLDKKNTYCENEGDLHGRTITNRSAAFANGIEIKNLSLDPRKQNEQAVPFDSTALASVRSKVDLPRAAVGR